MQKNIDFNKQLTFLNCPFCQNKIKTVLSEEKINLKKKYKQYQIE